MENPQHDTVPETFQIKVLSLTGQKFRINVCANDPVLAVLTTLGNYLHLPPQDLQLILKHRSYKPLIAHHRTIVSYGVRPGDTLHLQLNAIKSGPICFISPSAAIPYKAQGTSGCEDNKTQEESVPTVAWSNAPAKPLKISQERQNENQKLRKRMSEIRTKMERRKCLRRASIYTS